MKQSYSPFFVVYFIILHVEMASADEDEKKQGKDDQLHDVDIWYDSIINRWIFNILLLNG